MTDFDYKKYSLDNLEKWVSDAISSAEATPREIYDTIYNVVCEEYYYHKNRTSHCYDIMMLLNGNGNHIRDEVKAHGKLRDKEDACMPPWGHSDLEYCVNQSKIDSCDKDDLSPECQKSWNDFWSQVDEKQDKVVKWQLPVEIDGVSGEYYIQFPDDLMEAANIKEDDLVEWVDQGDGSFLLKKVDVRP